MSRFGRRDDELSAGTKQATDLGHEPGDVGEVLDDLQVDHDVHSVIGQPGVADVAGEEGLVGVGSTGVIRHRLEEFEAGDLLGAGCQHRNPIPLTRSGIEHGPTPTAGGRPRIGRDVALEPVVLLGHPRNGSLAGDGQRWR